MIETPEDLLDEWARRALAAEGDEAVEWWDAVGFLLATRHSLIQHDQCPPDDPFPDAMLGPTLAAYLDMLDHADFPTRMHREVAEIIVKDVKAIATPEVIQVVEEMRAAVRGGVPVNLLGIHLGRN